MLLLHNSRETLARLLNKRIRHLWTTYRRQKCNDFYPKYAMYMMFRWYDPRWSDMTILCNVVRCYGTCLQALCSLLFFCLKAYSFFVYGHFAKCTNQDSDCVYAGTNLRHKGWYDTDMIWYVCNVWCRSLMCTSNVAGNTQMASLDRQVTQNGLGVINAIAREYTMEGYHDTKMIWRLPSLAMMSGGDLDGDTKMMETRP